MVRAMKYEVSEQSRREAAASFLLFSMWKNQRDYDVLLENNDQCLEPSLLLLQSKGYVELSAQHHYTVSESGVVKAQQFEARYQALLTYLDLFGYVDLEAGEFAWAYYSECGSKAEWQSLLAEERWEDLRVAVIGHLGGSAPELVFFHFVSEERFDQQTAGWQTELAHGVFWDQVVEICDSAIQPDELAFEGENGVVTAQAVLDDIVEQGFECLRMLHPEDQEIHANLQAWYPAHGRHDSRLPPPLPGWEIPIWQAVWSL